MGRHFSKVSEKFSLNETNIRSRLLTDISVEERTLILAGIPTAVLEGGEGIPLVLLHGPGEYAAKWFRVFPELIKTHRVIAPDLPGHGETAAIEGSFGIERILSWLDELIETTCPSAPVLLGQILGGAIAARYASRHGDKVRSLVLSDALGLAAFEPRPDFAGALQQFVMKPNAETHDQFWSLCAYNVNALRDSLGDKWRLLKEYNLDRAADVSLHMTQQSLMEQFGMPAIPSDELSHIAVPTTLIWGKHDLATKVEVAEVASNRYGWPLYVVDDAADDPAMEQPAEFLSILRDVI